MAPLLLALHLAAVGPNVNLSADPARVHSESAIAVDPGAPQRLVAGCNQVTHDPLMLFSSADGGATWSRVEPGLGAATFQSGPSLAWGAAGRAYATALGVECLDPACTGSVAHVQLATSDDGGRSWSDPPRLLHSAAGDERVRVAVERGAGSACPELACAAWSEIAPTTSALRVACSPAAAGPWSPVTLASGPLLTAAALAFGPDGDLNVLWHDARPAQPSQSGFGFRRSLDCGATWSPLARFGPTRAWLDLAVPAQCERRVPIYPALDVDRSSGPRRGWLYAAWTDAEPGAVCPDYRSPCAGCPSSACATGCASDVYVSSSQDGGRTWSAPATVHDGIPGSDQFNPWLAVDEADGAVHVVWNDSRGDPQRLATDLYHRRSRDGGATWGPEERVTSAPTDETPVGAGADENQYGGYNGLAVHACVATASWTDRRDGASEQVHAAAVSDGACCAPGPPPADLGNRLRGVEDGALRPRFTWTDLGADEADYRVYRGSDPDFAAVPPALAGTSGGPDATLFTDPAPPAGPGCLHYRVRALGPCGEEQAGW